MLDFPNPIVYSYFHSSMMLVRELIQINIGLYVCTEFHQNKMIFI